MNHIDKLNRIRAMDNYVKEQRRANRNHQIRKSLLLFATIIALFALITSGPFTL